MTEAYFEEVFAYTKAQGQYEKFLYMNYAFPSQNVIASYGKQEVENLRNVSRRYDPEQVFQKLVPGFKLWP